MNTREGQITNGQLTSDTQETGAQPLEIIKSPLADSSTKNNESSIQTDTNETMIKCEAGKIVVTAKRVIRRKPSVQGTKVEDRLLRAGAKYTEEIKRKQLEKLTKERETENQVLSESIHYR